MMDSRSSETNQPPMATGSPRPHSSNHSHRAFS